MTESSRDVGAMALAPSDDEQFRVEHDTMGDVLVPAHARWGAQTQRAVENFPVSGLTLDPSLIRAIALVKRAATVANVELGVVDAEIGGAIATAAGEIADGVWDDHFPVDVFQTGSGTSSNMNVNEVIAHRASELIGRPVRPNDEPNASQSSNDVFPSAIHIAALTLVEQSLRPGLEALASSLRRKSAELAGVVKSGRTHLMDATPVTLGQEFGGYASAVELGWERVASCLERVGSLPLGGSAVGTALNVPDGYTTIAIERLVEWTSLPLREAADHFEAHSARDSLVELSGALRVVATSLYKIANDLRWMGSGPAAGLAEIEIPPLQPGSSIMPGKVNPVVPEAVCQVVAQVIGNDAAVAFGGAAGNFELNVMLPVIARNLLESIRLLGSIAGLFASRCIDGITANEERCRRYAMSSPSIGTSLNPLIGYERAAEVIKQATAEGKTIREVVLERGLVDVETVDRVLDVDGMARGGIR